MSSISFNLFENEIVRCYIDLHYEKLLLIHIVRALQN
jgi:hypothetical protein